MEFHLIVVIVLLLLAAIDLTVGVANDAVNFLNSALGSKAGKFKFLLGIAALGVFVGVFFSSGMMEIARKGIFNPEYFLLHEVLIIFVAVMFQDILLLDLFNTFGLPTSTTVSLIFGLFGSAVAISVIKILQSGAELSMISQYIEAGSVLKIVSAILLSIIFAFVFGSLVQYFTRMLFTFDYHKRFKMYGGIWSGLALTILCVFIILKGAKGATFINDATSTWMQENILQLALYMFMFWTVVLQLFISFTKLNVLKFIVWVGTFALAMAFAANDLVNFIGAPLAGLEAFLIAQNLPDPLTATMEALKNPIKAPIFFLFLAGVIMVGTLFLSRKAKNVTKTTINLGRQFQGYEKFEANDIARGIVRFVVALFGFISKTTPVSVKKWINTRFDQTKFKPQLDENGEPQAFDLIRAAVILIVSAGLISFATSFKLPLSTTYVTFIVAMAAALPDNAWGRESAVYRVSGVITVIAGWFFTAFMASLTAATIAVLLYYTEYVGLFALLALIGYTFYRSMKYSKKKEIEEEEEIKKIQAEIKSPVTMFDNSIEQAKDFVLDINETINKSITALIKFKVNKSYKAFKQSNKLSKEATFLIKNFLKLLKYTPEKEIESENSYIRVLNSFQEIADRMRVVTKAIHDYIENNHHELTIKQIEELTELLHNFDAFALKIADAIQFKNFSSIEQFKEECSNFNIKIKQTSTLQLKRIKETQANYTRSLLYLNLLNELNVAFSNMFNVCLTCKQIEEFMNSNLRGENKIDLNSKTVIK